MNKGDKIILKKPFMNVEIGTEFEITDIDNDIIYIQSSFGHGGMSKEIFDTMFEPKKPKSHFTPDGFITISKSEYEDLLEASEKLDSLMDAISNFNDEIADALED